MIFLGTLGNARGQTKSKGGKAKICFFSFFSVTFHRNYPAPGRRPPPPSLNLVHAPNQNTTGGGLHHARLVPRLVLHGGVAVSAGRAAAAPHPVHPLQINK